MVDQKQKFKLFIAQLAMNLGIILMLLPLCASVITAVADNGGTTAEGCSGVCEPGPGNACSLPDSFACSGDGCSCPAKITVDGACPCGYHPYGQK